MTLAKRGQGLQDLMLFFVVKEYVVQGTNYHRMLVLEASNIKNLSRRAVQAERLRYFCSSSSFSEVVFTVT